MAMVSLDSERCCLGVSEKLLSVTQWPCIDTQLECRSIEDYLAPIVIYMRDIKVVQGGMTIIEMLKETTI